jgi:hypothetical protein
MKEAGEKWKCPPWWVPDARGWATIAVIAFGFKLLWMVDRNPRLLDSAPFMVVVGGVLGAGGLGLILSFHFASSSGSAKANERADKALSVAQDAVAGGQTSGVQPGREKPE